MAATLYTGNGGTQAVANTTNGVQFQPDLVWVKSRSAAYSNWLNDSVRGAGTSLSSNLTDADTNYTAYFTSFATNGFNLAGGSNAFNSNGTTYVGWQWKAGGTAVSNTSGTITSQVSANTTAGFSVVTYTGTGANATVGHGLGVAPSMVICKSRGVSDWAVYHIVTTAAGVLWLNLTNAYGVYSAAWNSTAPTSSVFSVGTADATNKVSTGTVAYCFAAVAGYSAFGSYTGNGSTDGPFVYLGFRPRFVLVKNTGGASQWYLYDSSRDTYNIATNGLFPSSAQAETSIAWVDFLSNGFKVRATSTDFNGSGTTYIYACFAENPFKYANAR